MNTNTQWQSQMHPGILGEQAQLVIETAERCGAEGWKLNGAGGNGGSITLLFGPVSHDKRRFAEALAAEEGKWQEASGNASPFPLPPSRASGAAARIIPIYLSRYGLRVWESAQ
jgi:D-glycero-alpha-D-manno-heptose-7-phosphate kinase